MRGRFPGKPLWKGEFLLTFRLLGGKGPGTPPLTGHSIVWRPPPRSPVPIHRFLGLPPAGNPQCVALVGNLREMRCSNDKVPWINTFIQDRTAINQTSTFRDNIQPKPRCWGGGHLRAFLVHFPGVRLVIVWTKHCSRWTSLSSVRTISLKASV